MARKREKHDAAIPFTISTSASHKPSVPPLSPAANKGEIPVTGASVTPTESNPSLIVPVEVAPPVAASLSCSEEDGKSPLPEIFSLQSLLERQPAEPDWVIPGLLPTGVSLLAGPSQVDKPLLANQLGLSVATGVPFLERFPARQGYVLYLALAEDAQRVRGRAMRLLPGQDQLTNFTVALKWPPFRESGLADLEDTISRFADPRLIIVDPLEFVMPLHPASAPGYRMRQPNLPVQEPGFFIPLRELAARYRLAILLLHHLPDDWPANRRDPLAGLSPTGLTTASACNLLLTPTGESGSCTLHIAGAEVEEQRLSLSFETQSSQWRCTGKTRK